MFRLASIATLFFLAAACLQPKAETTDLKAKDPATTRKLLMRELSALMQEQRSLEATISEKELWAESYDTGNFTMTYVVDRHGNPVEKQLTDEEMAEDFRRESFARFRFIRPFVRPLSPLIMRAMKLWLRP